MSAVKNAVKVITKHVINYTDRDGNAQEKTFSTRINGNAKLYPGGSAFLCMVTLCLSIPTPAGTIIQVLTKLVARIRVDGELVLEVDREKVRGESWFDTNGDEKPGGMIYDLVGGESSIALAALLLKGHAPFAKRVKSARAALAKRAA